MNILLLLLVLPVGYGAWQAWRRSPVATTKVNLQVAAAVVLGVGGTIGATYLIAFLFPGERSGIPMVLTLMVPFVGVVGIMYPILRITDHYFVKVPKGAVRVSVHRRKLYSKWKALAIPLAFITCPALFPAGYSWMDAGIFDATFLLIAALFVPWLYLKANRFDRGMAALMANPWVHWRYTEEQWKAWASTQPSPPGGAAEAFFGPDGFLCGEEYLPWILAGSYLVKAAVSSGPPARLLLSFDTYVPSTYNSSTVRVEKCVPLPAGADRDLEILQEQLQRQCPKAAVHVTPLFPGSTKEVSHG